MAILRFNRLPKNQQYIYKPRYWDPKKEELEERLKRVHSMQEDDQDAMKARISSGLRRHSYGNTSYRRQQVIRSNVVLFGVVLGLLFITFLLLTSYLPRLAKFLETSGN
jgi:hypothetical protein